MILAVPQRDPGSCLRIVTLIFTPYTRGCRVETDSRRVQLELLHCFYSQFRHDPAGAVRRYGVQRSGQRI